MSPHIGGCPPILIDVPPYWWMSPHIDGCLIFFKGMGSDEAPIDLDVALELAFKVGNESHGGSIAGLESCIQD